MIPGQVDPHQRMLLQESAQVIGQELQDRRFVRRDPDQAAQPPLILIQLGLHLAHQAADRPRMPQQRLPADVSSIPFE